MSYYASNYTLRDAYGGRSADPLAFDTTPRRYEGSPRRYPESPGARSDTYQSPFTTTPRGRSSDLAYSGYSSGKLDASYSSGSGLTPHSYRTPGGPGGASSVRRSMTPTTTTTGRSTYYSTRSLYDEATPHTSIQSVSRRLDASYEQPRTTTDRLAVRNWSTPSLNTNTSTFSSALGPVTLVADHDEEDDGPYYERPGSPARTSRYLNSLALDDGRYNRIPSMNKEANGAFLPEMAPQDIGKLVVVLDLDETLVYAREGRTIVRPGCRELLQALKGRCELLVWTAGERAYAQGVIQEIDTSKAIQHCVYRHPKWWTGQPGYTKNLKALGRPLDRTIIVDNTPDCLRDHPSHSLLVSDFLGKPHESNDRTLYILRSILDDMIASPYRSVPDVLGQHRDAQMRRVCCDTGGTIDVFTLEKDHHLGTTSYSAGRTNLDMPSPSAYYNNSRW